MVCCFMNFHKQENAKDLKRHFDGEIDNAISRGCTTFITGKRHSEDELFAERVLAAAREYPDIDINLVFANPEFKSDTELEKYFISIADWEIYSYYVEY